jgi:hypothetical protein
MATISQVKAGLDEIAQIVRTARTQLTQSKLQVAAIEAQLNNIPATYADVLATINGFAPTGAYQTLAKDELAKLTTEFQALKSATTATKTDLAKITEF